MLNKILNHQVVNKVKNLLINKKKVNKRELVVLNLTINNKVKVKVHHQVRLLEIIKILLLKVKEMLQAVQIEELPIKMKVSKLMMQIMIILIRHLNVDLKMPQKFLANYFKNHDFSCEFLLYNCNFFFQIQKSH